MFTNRHQLASGEASGWHGQRYACPAAALSQLDQLAGCVRTPIDKSTSAAEELDENPNRAIAGVGS